MHHIQAPSFKGKKDANDNNVDQPLILHRPLHKCRQSLIGGKCTDGHFRVNKVCINVTGRLFETYTCILENFPDTLLGDPARRKRYWNEECNEYYFDTNQQTFEAIFQFYQTGYLLRPTEVPLQTFLEQLRVFQLDQATMDKFYANEGLILPEMKMHEGKGWKQQMWNTFEFPNYSHTARLMSILSIMCITLSVLLMCLETLPAWAVPTCKQKKLLDPSGHITVKNVPHFANEFFLLDNCILLWFAIEFTLRLVSCPDLKKFVKTIINILDAMAVIPGIVFLLTLIVTNDCQYVLAGKFFVILRFMRICRIAKLTRYNISMQLVIHAFRESFHYLMACFYLVLFCIIFFACLLYWIEAENMASDFKSIEEGLWWAFASMTTVGYGDVVPTTTAGRAVGGICIVVGFIILSLPSAIIVTNYNRYYRNVTGRGITDSEFK